MSKSLVGLTPIVRPHFDGKRLVDPILMGSGLDDDNSGGGDDNSSHQIG